MDQLARKCPNCGEAGHSTMDCPKLTGGPTQTITSNYSPHKAAKRRSSDGLLSGNLRKRLRNEQPVERRHKSDSRIRVKLSSTSNSFLRGEGKKSAGISSSSRNNRLPANMSGIKIRTTNIRSRSSGDQRHDSSGEEVEPRRGGSPPLRVKVDYHRASRHKMLDTGPNVSLSLRKGDLRREMKSKPLNPALVPNYRADDLRFTIPHRRRRRKGSAQRPPSSDGEGDNEEDEEGDNEDDDGDDSELKEEGEELTGVSDIKKTKTGSVIRFDSSEEEEEEEEENEEVKPVEKSDEKKVDDKEEVEDETQSSSEEEEGAKKDSSSSSSSSDSSGDSEEEETEKKVDLRDKYDDTAIVKRPLPVSSPPPEATQTTAVDVPVKSPERKRSRKTKKPSSSPVKEPSPPAESSSEESVKDDKKKIPEEKSRKKKKSGLSVLLRPRTKEEEEKEDERSDDGEEIRDHTGQLAAIQKQLLEKQEKIIPKFPFKTHSKPNDFPESKVPFIDSHCHIDYLFVRDRHYSSFADYVSQREYPRNFSGCVANFCDPPAWASDRMYPEIIEEEGVWGAFGLHPHNAQQWCKQIQRNLVKAVSHPKCVAWGEMGLDYGTKGIHEMNPDVIVAQKEAFRDQMKLALKMGKPFVIHGRGAENDAFEMMKELAPRDHKIHFHCYTGSWNIARKMLDHFENLFLGVTGLVTFGTASDVREVARKCRLDRILIETDAPYMKPANANRTNESRNNTPAMAVWIALKVAEIRRMELDEVLTQVRQNVKSMYGI